MRYQIAAFADEADASIAGQIDALRAEKISLLEIRGVDGRSVSELTPAEAGALRARLTDAGISVWSLGSPYGKSGIREPFGPRLDEFRRGLELALALGASHIRLFSFFLPREEAPQVFRDEVLERLSRFCEAAQGSGIVLCHENEKGIYGDTAPRCAEIHRALPDLRAVFDPANLSSAASPRSRPGSCSRRMSNTCTSRTHSRTAASSRRDAARDTFPSCSNSIRARFSRWSRIWRCLRASPLWSRRARAQTFRHTGIHQTARRLRRPPPRCAD